jgi:hypothetical protein
MNTIQDGGFGFNLLTLKECQHCVNQLFPQSGY